MFTPNDYQQPPFVVSVVLLAAAAATVADVITVLTLHANQSTVTASSQTAAAFKSQISREILANSVNKIGRWTAATAARPPSYCY